MGLGKYAKARADLDRAVAEGDDAEARYYRGRAWMGLGNARRAVADSPARFILRPLVAEVYYQSGLAHRALGNKAEAKADMAKAFQFDPKLAVRPCQG